MEGSLCALARMGLSARVGIAPSATLAQLAAVTATTAQPLVLVTPENAQAFLRDVPVTALLRLEPTCCVPPEIVARLERYGLRTLGQLARLGEVALRRQFGAMGSFLAAVAAGRDERPLQPTPLPPALHARLGVGFGTAPERVLAALDPFAAHVAARLRQHGWQARALRLRVRWECGCTERTRLSLRAHTADGAMLARELYRLLVPLLRAHAERAASAAADDRLHTLTLDGLWVSVSDFAPIVPDQATFWRTRDQRQAAAHLAAETLARRHGRSLLLRLEAARPAAIFDEECYRFADLPDAHLVGVATPRREPFVAQSASAPAAQADPWQAVPLRLHWW